MTTGRRSKSPVNDGIIANLWMLAMRVPHAQITQMSVPRAIKHAGEGVGAEYLGRVTGFRNFQKKAEAQRRVQVHAPNFDLFGPNLLAQV
jgi:hypothetical protein